MTTTIKQTEETMCDLCGCICDPFGGFTIPVRFFMDTVTHIQVTVRLSEPQKSNSDVCRNCALLEIQKHLNKPTGGANG
jgi:hypothetical protein